MGLSRIGQEPRVYVDRKLAPQLKLLTCEQSMGGGRLDCATFEIDFGLLGGSVAGRQITDNFTGKEVEVVVTTDVGERVIHWGTISKDAIEIKEDLNERLISTTELHHFGEPLAGYYLRPFNERGDGVGGFVFDTVMFNPVVDGIIRPNMYWQDGHPNGINFASCRLFHPPNLSESKKAIENWGQPEMWTLAEAIAYLQIVLIGPHIGPADRDELKDVLQRNGEQVILQNVQLRRGWFLPQCLDALLQPFGFGWSVEYLGRGARRLGFYRLGRRQAPFISYQAPGEAVDQLASPIKRMELTADSTRRLNNAFEIHGSRVLLEATFELIPAWEWDEAIPLDYNALGLDGDFVKLDPAKNARIGRDYVLNEGGDYSGQKTPMTNAEGETVFEPARVFDWKTVFPHDPDRADEYFSPGRRKFLPCLSRDRADGAPAFSDTCGVFLEWSGDGGSTWQPVMGKDYSGFGGMAASTNEGEQSFELLEKECGIRFTGTLPPHELIAFQHLTRLRITAAVEADICIVGVFEQLNRYQPERVPILIDAADRFHLQLISATSQTNLWTGADDDDDDTSPLISGAVDDSEAIARFARDLNEAWNQVDVSGELTLEGIDWGRWRIGESIQSIGRLDLFLESGPLKWPQIVGIRYDVANQCMVLTLDTWRDEPR